MNKTQNQTGIPAEPAKAPQPAAILASNGTDSSVFPLPEAIAPKTVLQTADVNSKRIFSNKTLCAQFLRDYSGLEVLKDVQPEDIEEVSLRYHYFDSRELNADSVVRIRLKSDFIPYIVRKSVKKEDTSNSETDESKTIVEKILVPVYIIPLFDHKNKVEPNVAIQLLCYIVGIWKSWEKEMGELGIDCSRSDFKYPFVFPVVYYEGTEPWTTSKELRSRVSNSAEFLEYIPNFRYCVISIYDYSDEELLEQNDEMSLLMLLNKIQKAEDVHRIAQLAADNADDILMDSSDEIVEIVAGTAKSIFRKLNVPEDEADGYIRRLRKDRKVGVLFENFEKVDIQAERQHTKDAVDALEAERESHQKDNQEKDASLKLAVRKLSALGLNPEQIAESLKLSLKIVTRFLSE